MAKKKKKVKKKAKKKMTTTLQTLDNFNKERTQVYRSSQRQSGNGIACPKCGTEMYDNPLTVFATLPPQIRIICPNNKCGHLDRRVQ